VAATYGEQTSGGAASFMKTTGGVLYNSDNMCHSAFQFSMAYGGDGVRSKR